MEIPVVVLKAKKKEAENALKNKNNLFVTRLTFKKNDSVYVFLKKKKRVINETMDCVNTNALTSYFGPTLDTRHPF